MELWIRSQDKEDLVKAYNFRILNKSYIAINVENRDAILDYLVVGKYATKERALEVLDEIQKMIKPTLIYTDYHSEIKQGVNNLEFDVVMQPVEDKIQYIQPNVIIYEMPKE